MSPRGYNDFVEFLKRSRFIYKIIHENMERTIESFMNEVYSAKSSEPLRSAWDTRTYHEYDEYKQILGDMAKSHANIMKTLSIGQTYEKRDIPVVVLSKANSHNNIVIIECGIHAREWISPAFCLWVIDDFLRNKTDLLTHFEFHLFPIVNADGYIHTWKRQRIWRKNR